MTCAAVVLAAGGGRRYGMPKALVEFEGSLLVERAVRTARAAYDGVPGHPVLLGRDHWAGVVETATGDEGARRYLAGRDVVEVDCTGLADPADLDVPPPGVPSAP